MASVDERDEWCRVLTDLPGWRRFRQWRFYLPDAGLILPGDRCSQIFWVLAYTIPADQLEELTRVVVHDIMREGLVKTQSSALVPYPEHIQGGIHVS